MLLFLLVPSLFVFFLQHVCVCVCVSQATREILPQVVQVIKELRFMSHIKLRHHCAMD